jgi:lysophospholipid acyltransferase (LPLAT)-like uncharacterized protein
MQTGAILIGVHAEAVPAWRARSWDRTIVPAPFSRIKLAYGPWYDPLEAPNGRNEVIFRGRSALEETVRLARSPADDATATS